METKVEEINDALKFDALSEAEKMTGKSYKEDKATESAGFLLHLSNSAKKQKLLSSVDDTTFSESVEEYTRKVTDFGFKTVLTVPFKSDGVEEHLFVMWHYEYSILLVWDTFHGSRNGGKFYYNWCFESQMSRCGLTSSGGCVFADKNNRSYSCLFNSDLTPHILPDSIRELEPKRNFEDWGAYCEKEREFRGVVEKYIKSNRLFSIWCGDHDCREALKHNITQLAENGRFLKKWKETPFLWLLHHGDSKVDGYDYEAITKARIAMLPADIRECIGHI